MPFDRMQYKCLNHILNKRKTATNRSQRIDTGSTARSCDTPGFGTVVALIALIGAALLTLDRQH
jgi:PGF-CTERM protein